MRRSRCSDLIGRKCGSDPFSRFFDTPFGENRRINPPLAPQTGYCVPRNFRLMRENVGRACCLPAVLPRWPHARARSVSAHASELVSLARRHSCRPTSADNNGDMRKKDGEFLKGVCLCFTNERALNPGGNLTWTSVGTFLLPARCEHSQLAFRENRPGLLLGAPTGKPNS